MLLRLLETAARRRGAKPGTSPVWTAAAFAAFLIRWHRRREAREAVSLREVLEPGESLLISHTAEPHG